MYVIAYTELILDAFINKANDNLIYIDFSTITPDYISGKRMEILQIIYDLI